MSSRTRDAVTPVILTLNEESNITATLESVSWARRVIILDSGSTDGTEAIARSFPNVDWVVRRFDTHSEQWQHALTGHGISTEYALALDADMRVTDVLLQEIESTFLNRHFAGGMIPFQFRVYGHNLVGSLYPPQLRLFRADRVRISQQGHTQCFNVDGPVRVFAARLIHDDWKQLDRWLASQFRYSHLERARLESAPTSSLKDRLRRCGVMPPLAAALAYVRAGGPFGGPHARYYASQRLAYECILQLQLLESRVVKSAPQGPTSLAGHKLL